MAEQLNFDLSARPALGRDAFFVSQANAVALGMVDAWRTWPGGKLLLSGPRGAGKTHLAHVWAADSQAQIISAHELDKVDIATLMTRPICVEDMHAIAGDAALETQSFHLHNLALAEGQPLLITGTGAPKHWGIALPDLASRLEGTAMARITAPDEALLGALFGKLFHDRQLAPLPDVIPYLARHAPRDFDAAQTLVADIDATALAEGREISRDLARRCVAQLSLLLQTDPNVTRSS